MRALKAEGRPLETLGKDRLTELDAWAHGMAQQFAPKRDEKTGRMEWGNDGDEARRQARCGRGPGARAQGRGAGDDPHENLMRIIDNWIANDEAEKAAKMIDVTPVPEPAPVEVKPNPDDDGIDGELA